MKARIDDVTWRRIDGDVVLLDLRRSMYLRLNPTGARLWELLSEENTEQSLVAATVATYGLPDDQAAGDVKLFLEQLRQADLLVE